MAVREASIANARLPPARFDVATGQTLISEARSDRFPTFSLGGAADDARPGHYDMNLEAFARGPLYDGAVRPRIRGAQANAAGAIARFRVTEADLELEVRSRFSDAIEAQAEVTIQRESGDRLTSYVDTIKLRRAGGEGVEADLLNAEATLAAQQAALVDALLRVDKDRVALDDLLGRDPSAPLMLAPPPLPAAKAPAEATPWLRTPDVTAAAADVRAAGEAIEVARAEHRPSLVYELGAGLLGVQPAQDPTESYAHRILRGVGGSVTLSLAWTIADFGGYQARMTRAELVHERALAIETVTVRAVRVAFEQARIDFEGLQRALDVNAQAVAVARDAYLATQSVYRGGSGSALAVIDAHRVWVSAAIANANIDLRYRLAEARYLREGGT